MGQINIQDTGYIKPTNSGTQGSSANRANSGTVISLKSSQFTPSLKRNISVQPNLSSNTPTSINLGSVENIQFQLSCVLNMKTATDRSKVAALLDMVRTNGYKLMWYDYTVSNEDTEGQLIYQVAQNSQFGHILTNGEKTKFSISNNFYHLHVIFQDIQPTQLPNNLMKYTLRGTVMKVEASKI